MAEEYKAQLSVKFGNGNMLNLRGTDVAELVNLATATSEIGMYLVTVAEELQGHATIAQNFGNVEIVATQPAPPGYQPQSGGFGGGGDAPSCAHGARMSWKTGTSKSTGKPWKGWFCNVQNDPTLAQCAPRFQR